MGERELRALELLDVPARFRQHLPLPFRTAGGVVFPDQGMFHPLKFLAGIAEELKIYEHSPVLSVEGHTARTPTGQITAERILIATRYPFLNRYGGYFMRLYQQRSYVLALDDAPTVGGLFMDAKEGGFTFRDYGDTVLIGGGGHRTGKSSRGWRPLQEFARRYWPQAKERAVWATQDCMTMDSLPYVGEYSEKIPHVLVATGYEGWGMTGAMTAARMLSCRVLGREHPCDTVFSPQRFLPLPRLAANGMEAALDLLSPLPRRCPHMGCALRYNRAERSWDCPCHGSRVARDGTLLDGPAQRGLEPPEQDRSI